jgi:L-serine dehydratase
LNNYPSIFNDVIGPVMRGPSSSHCAAAVRIGRIARDLMGGRIERVHLEFDSGGSLATTHRSQGSDMGLFGGLLGWDAEDERLADSEQALAQAGMRVEIRIADLGDPHPNTYRVTLAHDSESHRMIALSTGGGMIEVTEVDGVPLTILGDYFETLLRVTDGAEALAGRLRLRLPAEEILVRPGQAGAFVQVKSRTAISAAALAAATGDAAIAAIHRIAPVLPILSRRGVEVPFITSERMLAWPQGAGMDLAELAQAYESARGGIPPAEVTDRMAGIVRILRRSVAQGLAGTRSNDRILGFQSGAFKAAAERNALLDAGLLNRMIACVAALMEVKSAMGVIVAAPTAGSCGALPGAVIGAAEGLGLPEEEMTRAMLAAGMIGVFICAHATFAAEVCGCQAECGAGSGMAAAALVTLAGGTTRQAVDAASMAIQNVLGMICDPVANRVEVPCLGRNVLAAANAVACANMALAGFDAVVPLDEVIETMLRVGRSLPAELRCTAKGGLSITPTARRVEARLKSAERGAP